LRPFVVLAGFLLILVAALADAIAQLRMVNEEQVPLCNDW